MLCRLLAPCPAKKSIRFILSLYLRSRPLAGLFHLPIAHMTLPLAFGIRFADLYRRDGLVRVDAAFLAYLRSADGALADRLGAARAHPRALAPKQESELLVALAPHVEDFIAALFGIQRELALLAQQHHEPVSYT